MPTTPANDGGPGRDYNVADNKGPSTLITIWLVTSIAFIFTSGRLYVRGYMQNRLRSDDYLTIFSMVCPFYLLPRSVTKFVAGQQHRGLWTRHRGGFSWTWAAPGHTIARRSVRCDGLDICRILPRPDILRMPETGRHRSTGSSPAAKPVSLLLLMVYGRSCTVSPARHDGLPHQRPRRELQTLRLVPDPEAKGKLCAHAYAGQVLPFCRMYVPRRPSRHLSPIFQIQSIDGRGRRLCRC